MKMKKTKLPVFKTKDEEAKFWETHSFADYWDEFTPVTVVAELKKPKGETLVLRLNKDIKKKLEAIASHKGVTTSTIARIFLTEKLNSLPAATA